MRPISRVTAWCLGGGPAANRNGGSSIASRIFSTGNGRPFAGSFKLSQQRQVLLPQRAEAPLEHRLHQPALGAEIVIDRGQVHPGLEHDVPQRRARKAQLPDGVLGGVQDAGPRVQFSSFRHLS